MNEPKPQPRTPLGRILDEQARLGVPDNFDPWPLVFNRLQGVNSDSKVEQSSALTQIPTVAARPAKIKVWRRPILVGLGIAALLAIFLVAISALLLTNRPDNKVANIPTITPTSQAALAQTAQILTPVASSTGASSSSPVATSNIEATLGPIPPNCPPTPQPQELSSIFGPGVGSYPLWLISDGRVGLNGDKQTQYGYLQKALWEVEPSFTGTVTVRGTNLSDGTPLYFQAGGATPTMTMLLDTNNPGTPTGAPWKGWPSYIYATKAGCYVIEAQWTGGSSKLNLEVGAEPTTPTTPVATSIPPTIVAPSPSVIGGVGLNVQPNSFTGQGKLAFVSQGQLYALDGATNQYHQLTKTGETSGQFAWSGNGQWLAYVISDTQTSRISLRISHSDGSNSNQIPGCSEFAWSHVGQWLACSGQGGLWLSAADSSSLRQFTASGGFAWSPVMAELAVAHLTKDNGLGILTPDGKTRLLVNVNTGAPLWSPDGKTIAYTTNLTASGGPANAEHIFTIGEAGGEAKQQFVTNSKDSLQLLDWWPNSKGLLFQLDPQGSASIAADGLAVQSLELNKPAATPQTLVQNLVHPSWLSWSPDGNKFVAVEGSGRELWRNKWLLICDLLANDCKKVPQAANTVSLEPAWSPDGTQIAFVRADAPINYAGGDAAFAAWSNTRALWIVDAYASNVHLVASQFSGVQTPIWSHDGKHLLCGRTNGGYNNGLWLADVGADDGKQNFAARFVAGPLGANQNNLFGFYGYINWVGLLSWYS